LVNLVSHHVHAYRTILHDPKVYPFPEEYKPERWLKDGQLDADIPDPSVAFGYGRRQAECFYFTLVFSDILYRICPGRHFSDNSLYAMVSLVLSVYNITPPVDDHGSPIQLKPEVTPGILS
jgi:hypothetical protein